MSTQLSNGSVAGAMYDGIERRSGEDRRLKNTAWYQLPFFTGQRAHVRRRDDRKKAVLLDRYGTTLFAVIMLIICLSLLDALLTLILVVGYGALELNPILAVYLNIGTETFFIVKYMLTVFSIFILLIYKEAISLRYRGGRFVFILTAMVFGTVVIWEVYLLMRYT